MRRFFLYLSISVFLLCGISAIAETYTFEEPRITLSLPDGAYETVLTKENLAANELFINGKGSTPDLLAEEFQSKGILLQAWDSNNDRCLVLSALQDVDAQQLFDINIQDESTRRSYRLSHSKGTAYSILGYDYSSAAWKNYETIGRFLMLKYSLKTDGAVQQRGYQRRAIRNGYTVTVDMQIFGRQLETGDNTALNKIMDGFSFTEILPVPALPVKYVVSTHPPQETNSGSFKMTGKSTPGASISAVIMSLNSTKAEIFETIAEKSGSFTLPVALPSEGLYYMTVTINAAGCIEKTAEYTITYDNGLLPVNLDTNIPEILTGDTLKISGTSIQGVVAQLVVNNKSSSKRVGAGETFSFTVDTSKEGDYAIELSFSKKGLDTRTYSYLATRKFTDTERNSKIKDVAIKPAYSKLTKHIDTYDGRVFGYTAYITDVKEVAGEWIVFMALSKSGEQYSDMIVISCEKDPGYPLYTSVKVYGTLVGNHYTYVEGSNDLVYPLLELLFFEPVQ